MKSIYILVAWLTELDTHPAILSFTNLSAAKRTARMYLQELHYHRVLLRRDIIDSTGANSPAHFVSI